MTFPVTIELFGSKLQLHFILEVLAYFIGFRYFLYQRKKLHQTHISDGNWQWIFIGAVFGGFIGSHVVGIFERPDLLFTSPNLLLFFMGNKTILGGLLGGLLGVEGAKKIIGEKSSSGNQIVFALLLAMIIGRIGCFLNGVFDESIGKETNFYFAMDQGDGKQRHPIMLYELIYLIITWFYLYRIKNSLEDGRLFKIFMITYCLFRFGLDFLKETYEIVYGMTTIQITCIFGLIYYTIFIRNTIFENTKAE